MLGTGCWGQVRGACVDPDSVAIELLGTGREEGGVRAGLGAGSGVRRAACQGPSEAFPEERTRCAGSGVGGARSWRAEGPERRNGHARARGAAHQMTAFVRRVAGTSRRCQSRQPREGGGDDIFEGSVDRCVR